MRNNTYNNKNVTTVCIGLQKVVTLSLLLFFSVGLWAQGGAPELKVDLDMSGRQLSEVQEIGYTSWITTGTGKTVSETFEGVTVTFTDMNPDARTWIENSGFKEGLENPYYARLVSDGIRVKNANNLAGGAHIKMTLSGLATGNHTLMVYLNHLENLTGLTFCDIEVFLNGVLHETVTPSVRVTSNTDATITYMSIVAQEGVDVVVEFKAKVVASENSKNVTINGFELNTPNVNTMTNTPIPADRDEHVDADNGNTILSWSPPKRGNVSSYDVYFGEDGTEVASANRLSSLFKGNQVGTTYTTDNLYSMKKYYWRVDVIEADNDTIKGSVWYFQPRQLAFPGAEGYGRHARGGRGGKVVAVTNLNDNGPGSLRYVIENADGPTTIVFSVGGIINLTSKNRIALNKSYITVAGQTAPGKGICIRSAPFGISGGQDNIIRFVRVRLGKTPEEGSYTADGMGMAGTNYSIIDHSSISWTIDEAFSSRNAINMTLQNTLISEALHVAGHQNYGPGSGHGYAATIGGDTASFLRNLLAHNHGRNWSLGGGLKGGYYAGHLDIMNNVVYNYGGRVTDGGAHEVNFVNNYYKQGRHSTSGMLKAQHEGVGQGTQRYHARGNVLEKYNSGNYGVFDCTDDSPDSCGCSNQWSSGEAERYQSYLPQPFFPSHATKYKATDAYKIVLSDVGCNNVLDEHDYRVIMETIEGKTTYRGSYTGNYGIPDYHNDVGGYEEYPEVYRSENFDSDNDGLPDWWEVLHGTNPNSPEGDFSDTNADLDGDGYTNLDDYLNYLAMPNYETKKNRQVSIDLGQLTLGFTKSPVYTVESETNGKVTIDGKWARFMPTGDFTGIAYFTFKVKDSENTEWERTVGVLVEP